MPFHVRLLAVAAGYLVLALGADAVALDEEHVLALWPSNGLLVSVLLLSDTRRWPAFLAAGAAGAATFNLIHYDLDAVLVWCAANVVVVWVTAATARRFTRGRPDTSRIPDVLVLSAAGLAGPAVGALVAAGGLALAADAAFGRVFVIALLSNAVGVGLIAPLVLAAVELARQPGRRAVVLELVVFSALAAAATVPFVVTDLPVAWLALVVPIAAALRRGVVGAATAFLPVAAIAIVAATYSDGTFAAAVGSDVEALAFTQVFIIITSTLANILGAASRQLEIALVGLRRSEDRFRLLVEGVRDHAMFTIGADGRIDSWNASARRMFGYREDEVAGVPLHQLAAGSGGPELLRAVDVARATGRFEGESGIRCADGVTFLGHITVSPLDRGIGFAVVVRDVTESRRSEGQLRHMALHDALTGLPNRTLLMDRLEVAVAGAAREGGSVAVLFCDLDRFKVINDSLGHAAGDTLLAEVADRLREVVRPEDTVARFGGDEFVVCFRRVAGPKHAIRLAERVRARLAHPVYVGGEKVYVGASVGIALGDPGVDVADLLGDADLAMYRAKESGTGYALASEEDRARAIGRLRDETAVRGALERGELTLHYQPIVDVREHRIVALEALMRWRHPVDGLLGPGSFIRVAEDTGAIVPIGAWVVREACEAGRRFRRTQPDLVININVSARQLGAGDLPATVERELTATGTDPSLICLELTETELIEDVQAYTDVLARLEQLGVRLAIDDFGAGYSSLRYLSSLPIQTVKVDRAFVSGLAANDGGAPILRAAVSMARAFELDAIAEGVERADQVEAILRMGYRLAQGFHFARPLPEEDAAALLVDYRPEKPIRGSLDASLT